MLIREQRSPPALVAGIFLLGRGGGGSNINSFLGRVEQTSAAPQKLGMDIASIC